MIIVPLLYIIFFTLSIISLFSPRLGGFWFKYLKLKEPSRLKAFLVNFCIVLTLLPFLIQDKAKDDVPKQQEMSGKAKADAQKKAEEDARKREAYLKSPAGFSDQMAEFKIAYAQAQNEIKKSEIFNQARNYEKNFFESSGNQITNWSGYLTTIGTSKGGNNLRLSVKIDSKISISFREGYGLFDGISPSSIVYNQAREFKEGDCVVFSGTINPNESSITEAGAMRAPYYDFKFNNLARCSN